MTFYLRLQGTAKKLIKKYGQPLTFTAEDKSGGFDSSGNIVAPIPNVSVLGDGVKLDYTAKERENTSIEEGDAKILYSGTPPDIGMFSTIDGEKWRVINLRPLTPAGTNIMYTLQVRR